MTNSLLNYTHVLEIVGNTLKPRVPQTEGSEPVVRFNDLALVKAVDGHQSLGQVIFIDRDVVTLQVFSGTKDVFTGAPVAFLGHAMQVSSYSENILGRVLDGAGEPIDGGPDLSSEI